MPKLAHAIPERNAELCESAELADDNPEIEYRLRRLCRLEYLEACYWKALARLVDERERLEAELAAIDAEAQKWRG